MFIAPRRGNRIGLELLGKPLGEHRLALARAHDDQEDRNAQQLGLVQHMLVPGAKLRRVLGDAAGGLTDLSGMQLDGGVGLDVVGDSGPSPLERVPHQRESGVLPYTAESSNGEVLLILVLMTAS